MDPKKESFDKSKICFLSNFPPRECGIATFTKDLATSIDKRFNPKVKSKVIAINDEGGAYNYDKRVIMQVGREDIEDFINTAKKINENQKIKLVCIQHEFGIFGGDYGSYLIPFLEAVKKPVIVTFHSVLPRPDEIRAKTVRFICSKAAAVIVMAKKAIDILNKDYGVAKEKIHLVYHGIPNVNFSESAKYKNKLRLEGKTVLSTFGLLSRGKGIEYMIEAMPKLVEKYPNLLYLVIGETHPVVREDEGEEYRKELMRKVKKLGLSNHVKFYNKYLSLKEIIEYLLATDVYICTNLDRSQIVSGTLSYAMGCGRCVVSTPSVYAKELLKDKKGMVVKLKNPDSFAEKIDEVLEDEELRKEIERNAYAFTRQMTWSNVAARYLHMFNSVIKLREEITEKYPIIKLNHFKNLTDEIGMLQFSKHSQPDKDSGYTIDDNARALIVSVLHHNLSNSPQSIELSKKYLEFLDKMRDEKNFHDFLNNQKVKTSEDAVGRTLWALGYSASKSKSEEISTKAKEMFEKSVTEKPNSPRAIAFSTIGLCHYYEKFNNENYLTKINEFADSLCDLYDHNSSNNWQWFESYLTYANSKIPESLFFAYKITNNERYLAVAKKTLNFLMEILFNKGYLSLIGQKGWFNKNGERAFFDQQPIDASYLVQTYLTAYSITKEKEYYDKAVLAFNWFLGKNHLNQMVYDENTGGCYDGFSETSLNLNQGAESTISYLMARLFLEEEKLNRPGDSIPKHI